MSKRILLSLISIATLLIFSASSLAKNVFCVHIYNYKSVKCCSQTGKYGCESYRVCEVWDIDKSQSKVTVADKKKIYGFAWQNWGPISGKKYYSICSSSHFPNTYETITTLTIKASPTGLVKNVLFPYVKCTFNSSLRGTKRGGGTAEVRIHITGSNSGTCNYLYYDRSGKPNTIQGNYSGKTG